MIRIQQKLFDALAQGGQPAVLGALQDALRLEHATIPLYLYALYSLDRAKNPDIVTIIRSVVIEEMLHMTLVCNIINALGGAPAIDDSTLIPKYPGPLPGGVESDLTVHLAPYSPNQLALFLKIEEPEAPLEFRTLQLLVAAPQPPETIGGFYSEIRKQIVLLRDDAFVDLPRNQVGPELVADAVIVKNAETAVAAIDLIVEQGEGTSQSPGEVVGNDYAHFYRFNQIAKGKHIVKNPEAAPDSPPDQQYIYAGAPIVFDQSGVRQAPCDPKAADYKSGTDARHAMDAFNETYTGLLKSLQQAFNGAPNQLVPAIETMSALAMQARKLMSTPSPAGGMLGPSFEYRVVSPA